MTSSRLRRSDVRSQRDSWQHSLIRVCCAAIVGWGLFLPSVAAAQASHDHETGDVDAYFLVIDHSGSMKEAGTTGAPRWQEMQEHARMLLSQVPLGSDVQAATFSNELSPSRRIPFRSESDRAAAINEIMNMCESPTGNTRLFDSLGEILERAEQVYRDAPQREVRVLMFTDGLDTSSTRWTHASLQERFHKLVSDNPNLWLFFTQLQDEKRPVRQVIDHPHAVQHAFKPPILLKTCPRTVKLKDPALHPRQEWNLEFTGPTREYWRDLADRNVGAQFVADDPNLSGKVGEITLRPGTQSVSIQFPVNSQLTPGQARRATIQLDFPQLPGHQIRAPNLLDVEFESPEPPYIAVDSATPPRWRQPTPVRLANAAGAKQIEWLTDDGTRPLVDPAGEGAAGTGRAANRGGAASTGGAANAANADGAVPVSPSRSGIVGASPQDATRAVIIFNRIGRPRVAARITWPNDSVTTVETPVEIAAEPAVARARVELMTPKGLRWLMGGKYRLIDESTGDIAERKWFVNGVPQESAPDSVWVYPNQNVSFRLVTTAPLRTDGVVQEDDVLVDVAPVGMTAWLPYLFMASLATWVGLRSVPLFFGMWPYGGRLYYSHTRLPKPQADDPYVDLNRYWHARRREAVVPLSNLFAKSSYWGGGGGRREQLTVRIPARDESTPQVFQYSGQDSRFVAVSATFRDAEPGICCHITDDRCTDSQFRKLYFRLEPGKLQRSRTRILALATLIVAAAASAAWSLGWLTN